ncbi:MbtH family NRPS accessory protein [Massilia sp. erpn]|nr:MbtH family NRPS accessory protein [Massilia sp. erpn]
MEQAIFVVVKNDEEQYSIWQAEREVPAGWHVQPCRGPKEECLNYIEQNWTDMRPASLKRAMTN